MAQAPRPPQAATGNLARPGGPAGARPGPERCVVRSGAARAGVARGKRGAGGGLLPRGAHRGRDALLRGAGGETGELIPRPERRRPGEERAQVREVVPAAADHVTEGHA